MTVTGRTIRRYSEAFKQQVVSEISRGEKTISQAQKVYDIRGGQTIQNWLKCAGQPCNKIVRIETVAEVDRIKQLEDEKRQLEQALAQTQVKLLSSEAMVDLLSERYGVSEEAKKNLLRR